MSTIRDTLLKLMSEVTDETVKRLEKILADTPNFSRTDVQAAFIAAQAQEINILKQENERLQKAHDHQYSMAGQMLREAERNGAERDALKEDNKNLRSALARFQAKAMEVDKHRQETPLEAGTRIHEQAEQTLKRTGNVDWAGVKLVDDIGKIIDGYRQRNDDSTAALATAICADLKMGSLRLPETVPQIQYWQANAIYWKREHEEVAGTLQAKAKECKEAQNDLVGAKENVSLLTKLIATSHEVLDAAKAPPNSVWERVMWLKAMRDQTHAELAHLRGVGCSEEGVLGASCGECLKCLRAEVLTLRNKLAEADRIIGQMDGAQGKINIDAVVDSATEFLGEVGLHHPLSRVSILVHRLVELAGKRLVGTQQLVSERDMLKAEVDKAALSMLEAGERNYMRWPVALTAVEALIKERNQLSEALHVVREERGNLKHLTPLQVVEAFSAGERLQALSVTVAEALRKLSNHDEDLVRGHITALRQQKENAEEKLTEAQEAARVAEVNRAERESAANSLASQVEALKGEITTIREKLSEADRTILQGLQPLVQPLAQERDALKALVHKTAAVWMQADPKLGIAFDGAIDGAMRAAVQEVIKLRAVVEDMRKRKDDAYTERNRVVAAFAKLATIMDWSVSVTRTAIPGWSEDWHGCVFIDTPQGQVSWHFHDSHADLFKGLPHRPATWDGHTTLQKYERLEALAAKNPPAHLLSRTEEAMNKQDFKKLQDFKTLVHRRLDEMGIPKFEGEACRIVLRLHQVEQRLIPAGATCWNPEDSFHKLCIAACLEANRARGLFPKPDHLTLALAEEAGAVTKAVLDHRHGKYDLAAVRKEIVQTMAMCLRLATEGDPTVGLKWSPE